MSDSEENHKDIADIEEMSDSEEDLEEIEEMCKRWGTRGGDNEDWHCEEDWIMKTFIKRLANGHYFYLDDIISDAKHIAKINNNKYARWYA